MSTVVQDMQSILPSLAPPSDDGVAHITNRALNCEVAYCGHRRATRHSEHGPFSGERCSCGAPICPTCLQVRRSYDRSGAWEGPTCP